MAHAQGKGRIHDVFRDCVADLADQAGRQALALRGQGLRPWNRPEKAGDPLDVPAKAAFDRSAIGANYEEAIASADDPGTVGDAISLVTQGDYVAARERGFRARHCTPCRLLAMHAAARRGQGHPRGAFLGVALGYAQDALKAGQS